MDADSVFLCNPPDPLGALGRSPIHVPLDMDISAHPADDSRWGGVPLGVARDTLHRAGVPPPIYSCSSSFWIVHHDAIDIVHELARNLRAKERSGGIDLDVSIALAFAMQILCANPDRHRISACPELWGNDVSGRFRARLPATGEPEGPDRVIWPAILHLPHSKDLLAGSGHGREGRLTPSPSSSPREAEMETKNEHE